MTGYFEPRNQSHLARGGVRCVQCGLIVVAVSLLFGLPARAGESEAERAKNSELAKTEGPANELASIDRRTEHGVRPESVVPGLALLNRSDIFANADHGYAVTREQRARRIAARYSIMTLAEIPRPIQDYELEVETHELDKPEDQHRVSPRASQPIPPRTHDEKFFGSDRSSDNRGFFHSDLTSQVRPVSTQREIGLARLARKTGFRHFRRQLREDLKSRYEQDPSFDYTDFLSERGLIWSVGRSQAGGWRESQGYAEFRGGIDKADSTELERSIELLSWGPFRLDDGGSLSIDIKKLVRRSPMSRDVQMVEEPGVEPKGRSLFRGKVYRLDTDVRFTPHFSQLSGGVMREFFGKVRASVEVEFFDRFFHNRYMSTELETVFKANGESELFFNIVIYGK